MQSDLSDDPDAPIRDPRIKAAVVCSPTGTGIWGLTEDSWAGIDVPCMTFIGSFDFDFVITVDPQQRRVVFELSGGPDQYLVTLGGALHTAFDDFRLFSSERMYHTIHHDYVRMATTAFFDAHLNGDAEARDWLLERGLEAYSRGRCSVEFRSVTAAQ
jgi:predicted dienelactone hydrolase